MNKLLKFLFIFCLFSIILGPLGALPIGVSSVNVYLTDIIVAFLSLFWLVNISSLWKLIRKDKIFLFFLFFVFVAFVSFLLTPISLSFAQKNVSFLYLVRFTLYSSIYLTMKYLSHNKLIESEKIYTYLIIVGITLAVLGWLQYLLYPDLRNLYYLGWDPHYKRIFSTFLDPNYLGLVLVLSLILLFSQNIVSGIISWFFRIGVFITFMFTYSRSSYLALIIAAFFYSIVKKKYKISGLVLVMVVCTALVLPRPSGEGVRLERLFSLEQRIQNWQSAINIWSNHPLLGVGFNTIRFAKKDFGINYSDDWLANHAGAGFDNSFLFVGVTTGILGLISYLLFLYKCFQNGNLLVKISLVAVVAHSFFLNSLFFPWVMVWVWILLSGSCRSRVPNSASSRSR